MQRRYGHIHQTGHKVCEQEHCESVSIDSIEHGAGSVSCFIPFFISCGSLVDRGKEEFLDGAANCDLIAVVGANPEEVGHISQSARHCETKAVIANGGVEKDSPHDGYQEKLSEDRLTDSDCDGAVFRGRLAARKRDCPQSLPSEEDGKVSKEREDSLAVLREKISALCSKYEGTEVGLVEDNLVGCCQDKG